MFGASQEQQDDVASAAREVGGYFELLEQANTAQMSSTQAEPAKPTYTIDPQTKEVRLALAD
ncbi:MAG TPA: hypothetical protein VGG92_04080 [Caulobacteraceae bacterium]